MGSVDATAEEWRPVIGHEGLYEVSDQGHVRSFITGKILRPSDGGQTHLHVQLVRPRRTGKIHQLVAEAFHGPRPAADAEIRHLNGVATDNRATNLVYGTRSDNAEDSKRHGTHFYAGLTYCKRGHELSGDNLQKTPGGKRRTCLACRRERAQLYRSGTQVTTEGYCINGHRMTPENRYTNGARGTRCKPCALERRKAA